MPITDIAALGRIVIKQKTIFRKNGKSSRYGIMPVISDRWQSVNLKEVFVVNWK